MADQENNTIRKAGEVIRAGSPAMIIPALLAVGPLLGFFAGSWIGGKLGGHHVGGGLFGLLLGGLASLREVIKIARQITRDQELRDALKKVEQEEKTGLGEGADKTDG